MRREVEIDYSGDFVFDGSFGSCLVLSVEYSLELNHLFLSLFLFLLVGIFFFFSFTSLLGLRKYTTPSQFYSEQMCAVKV